MYNMSDFENEDRKQWETESRIGNCSNHHQGKYKKVLAVCSAGMLRSPTIQWVLSQKPYGYNCRAAGIAKDYALVQLDDVLITWADEIVCADSEHYVTVTNRLATLQRVAPVINLKLPDIYEYRNPKLVKLIKERYNEYLKKEKP